LLGLNYSDNYTEGQLSDSQMISARRYPYIATKNARTDLGYENVSAIYAFDGLWTVRNGKLYCDAAEISGLTLTSGMKQFAAMYKKLVIFPDKKYVYIDGSTKTAHDMEAKSEGTGATVTVTEQQDGDETITTCTITISYVDDLTSKFAVGDVIEIDGFTNTENQGMKTIKALSATEIEVEEATMVDETAAGTVSFERNVPTLDYICVHDNRLWGCNNETRTIYASRIDDPTNFNDLSGNANDSWMVDVATDGDFTGCASMSGAVIFFKEHSILKVLGSYAAEFQTNNYQMEGVKTGCNKSIQNIGETLYYVGVNGVYVYNGGTASLISYVFGEKRLSDAVAGHDSNNYYLSALDGDNPLFLTYHMQSGLWLKEDTIRAYDIALNGNTLNILSNEGKVLTENTGTEAVPFSITFKPFYESVKSGNTSTVAFAKKRYSKLYLRMELGRGANVKVEVREDDGLWKEVTKIVGKGGLYTVPVVIGRCDKYELRLSGKGAFCLLNMMREYRIGSAR
jgi:hypothetical protein